MENIAISKLMKIINSLSAESKLEILSKLSNSLKIDFKQSSSLDSTNNNEVLLDELFGAWKDLPDELEEDIIAARTTSDRVIDFD